VIRPVVRLDPRASSRDVYAIYRDGLALTSIYHPFNPLRDKAGRFASYVRRNREREVDIAVQCAMKHFPTTNWRGELDYRTLRFLRDQTRVEWREAHP